MIASSITSPLTCVNRKNFIAAYARPSCPHTAIRKYIGTSITSQKKKNRKRSSAVNTPTTPASVHSRLNWKNPVRASNFGPRRHDRDDAEHERQRDHHQRQPVHCEDHLDAKTRNPREPQLGVPARVVHDRRCAGRERIEHRARDQQRGDRDIARQRRIAARSLAHASRPAPSSSRINSSRITVHLPASQHPQCDQQNHDDPCGHVRGVPAHTAALRQRRARRATGGTARRCR